MKIYVAAASSEIDRAKRAMAALRAEGIEVTSTWPEVIERENGGVANQMHEPRDRRAAWAKTDLDQVYASDVFWLLLPERKPTAGAHTEFGFALMLASMRHEGFMAKIPGVTPLRIICSGVETSIFTALAEHFESDHNALSVLKLHAQLELSLKPRS